MQTQISRVSGPHVLTRSIVKHIFEEYSPDFVRVMHFYFSKTSRPALGLTQPPVQWVLVALPPGGKAAGA
jgi:hypothetical protein